MYKKHHLPASIRFSILFPRSRGQLPANQHRSSFLELAIISVPNQLIHVPDHILILLDMGLVRSVRVSTAAAAQGGHHAMDPLTTVLLVLVIAAYGPFLIWLIWLMTSCVLECYEGERTWMEKARKALGKLGVKSREESGSG